MIEIRRRWTVALVVVVAVVVVPVATSRAQSAGDSGDSITITKGAAAITLNKDGTIVLKGTKIVLEGPNEMGSCPVVVRGPTGKRSDIF